MRPWGPGQPGLPRSLSERLRARDRRGPRPEVPLLIWLNTRPSFVLLQPHAAATAAARLALAAIRCSGAAAPCLLCPSRGRRDPLCRDSGHSDLVPASRGAGAGLVGVPSLREGRVRVWDRRAAGPARPGLAGCRHGAQSRQVGCTDGPAGVRTAVTGDGGSPDVPAQRSRGLWGRRAVCPHSGPPVSSGSQTPAERRQHTVFPRLNLPAPS